MSEPLNLFYVETTYEYEGVNAQTHKTYIAAETFGHGPIAEKAKTILEDELGYDASRQYTKVLVDRLGKVHVA